MAEDVIVEAFLDRHRAYTRALRSDGRRLFVRGALVAEWHKGSLRLPAEQLDLPADAERAELRDLLLWKLQKDRVLRQVVRGRYPN